MKRKSAVVESLPQTLKKLRAYKPVIEKSTDSAINAARTMTEYKDVEELRKKLRKDYEKIHARYAGVVEAVKNEFDIAYKECVTVLYDDADLKLFSMSSKLEAELKARKAKAEWKAKLAKVGGFLLAAVLSIWKLDAWIRRIRR